MPPKLVVSPDAASHGGVPVSLDIEAIDDVPGTDESEPESDVQSDVDMDEDASENSDDSEDSEASDAEGSGSEADADVDADGTETAGGSDDEAKIDGSAQTTTPLATTSGSAPTELADLPGELQELAEQLAPGADIETSDDDEDWGDRLQQSGLLGEDGVAGEALLVEHPEAAIANVDEVRAAANIIRDSSGDILDPYHTTTPIITRYEYAKVIGQRAEQLAAGGMSAIDIPYASMNPRDIAIAEYKAKAIPFIIRRPLPSGKSEYWRVRDLIDVSY